MIGSLFSGIGGLELGLEWAGLGPVAWQVEIEPYCRAVLARHWPAASREVTDVRAGGVSNLLPVGVICGGFPCQDVSSAGKRAGLAGAKSGLWFEFRRVIGELQPTGVVIENVASGASAWLPQISSDLADLGYRARALGISAADVGAPHRRARVFVVAVADADGAGRLRERSGIAGVSASEAGARPRGDARRSSKGRAAMADTDAPRGRRLSRLPNDQWQTPGLDAARCGEVADADSERLRHEQGGGSGEGWRRAPEPRGRGPGAAQPGLAGVADGLPGRLDGHRWPAGRGHEQHAWEPARTVAPRSLVNRRARCRALGNAVVPQCAMIAGLVLRGMMEGRA